MGEPDYHWVTDWSQTDSKCRHAAIVGEERLQVADQDPGGVGRQLPGGTIGQIRDEHYVVTNDPVLQVKARGVPGEGQGGGGNTRGSQVRWSSRRICS